VKILGFVLTPRDDPDYAPQFLEAPERDSSRRNYYLEMLRLEPLLNPAIKRRFRAGRAGRILSGFESTLLCSGEGNIELPRSL
jgi:hypothetical protein